MKSLEPVSVAEIARCVGGRVLRGEAVLVSRISNLETAEEGDVAYVQAQKFLKAAESSNASCLIIAANGESTRSLKTAALVEVANPRLAIALIADLLYPPRRQQPSVHKTAVIAPSAKIDPTVLIGPYVCIGEETTIGAGTQIKAGTIIGNKVKIGCDCVLHPGVILYDNLSLGDRVILHGGACIGTDGFGYERGEAGYHKFPQIGTVIIENDVELGSYTCVDRAALGQTRIGRGTKLDNLVHVGHNCEIGERVVIAAQTGISGSVVIEDDAVIGGQVGFGDHSRVESGVIIGSKAGVLSNKVVRLPKSVNDDDDRAFWGIPVQPLKEFKKLNSHLKRVPQMRAELKELTERVKMLENELRQNEE